MSHYTRDEKLKEIHEFLNSGLSLRKFSSSKEYSFCTINKWLQIYNAGRTYDLYSRLEKQSIICQLSVFETLGEKYEAAKYYGFYQSLVSLIGILNNFKMNHEQQKPARVDSEVKINKLLRLSLGFKN